MIPMLAKTYGPRFNSFPCWLQPKLNGVRALYQTGVFQSRDEKLWKPGVLRHLLDELATFPTTAILDGELYVHGWRLQRINGAVAVNRIQPSVDTSHVEFHVFDTVDTKKTFSERCDILQTLHQLRLPHVKVVPCHPIRVKEQLDQYFQFYVSQGYEGVMLRPDGPYEFGEHWSDRADTHTQFRSKSLWKYKLWEDGEYLCVGITEGAGKASGMVGALILDDQKTNTSFFVGTGFTNDERRALWLKPPVARLVRVRYPYLSSNGIPQCPSFVAVL